MLTRLREVLQSRPALTLAEVAALMQLPVSAVEPMLAQWVGKGRVRVEGAGCGGGCGGCASSDCRIYRWLDAPAQRVVTLHPVA